MYLRFRVHKKGEEPLIWVIGSVMLGSVEKTNLISRRQPRVKSSYPHVSVW